LYYIKEIFKSIQGEGFYSGRPAIFVRFSGCNLWNGKIASKKRAICSFCDTDFVGTNGSNGGEYDLNELVKKVEESWNSYFYPSKKFVILTGGEPLLQVDHILVNKLKESGFVVAVETNGTIKTSINFDWICVSPKENSSWELRNGDEVKIVYPQYKFNLNTILKLDFRYFFLQPMYNHKVRVNINKTIEYCKSHKPWFPSFQLHKSLGIS